MTFFEYWYSFLLLTMAQFLHEDHSTIVHWGTIFENRNHHCFFQAEIVKNAMKKYRSQKNPNYQLEFLDQRFINRSLFEDGYPIEVLLFLFLPLAS